MPTDQAGMTAADVAMIARAGSSARILRASLGQNTQSIET